jgi:serine phosphatase RsbU (regulator of sigma subunit)
VVWKFSWARQEDNLLKLLALTRKQFRVGVHFIYQRVLMGCDIVSGDFYWMEKSGDNLLFAVGDCTGHGVPDAMLSMLAKSLLNQAVNENAF